jgi:predicted nucleic acid-binding protein
MPGLTSLIFRTSTMIVDASAVVPWLIQTPFSTAARRLKPEVNKAPAILLLEATNALLKYVRARQIGEDDLTRAITSLTASLDEVVDDIPLLPHATRIALANDHKIYDCLYLALALDRREPLATADRRMAALAQSLGIETTLIEPEPE